MAELRVVIVTMVHIFLSMMVAPSSATTVTVSWSLGTDYSSLTSSNTLVVGDTLLFSYGAGHTVDEVTQSDYQSCTTGNSISSDSSGTTSITLKTPGTHYFICAAPGHCSGGMKLAVTVSASGGVTGGIGSSAGGVTGGSGSTATPTASCGGGSTATTSPTTTTGIHSPASFSASVAVSPALAAAAVTWVAALLVLIIS